MRSLLEAVRGHGRALGTSAVAAGAAATATAVALVARRRHRDQIVLPDAEAMAAETAVSVHNAAKGSVVTTVREADVPDRALVTAAIHTAVVDSSSAGADVVAAAIGGVEGAIEIAHLVGERPHELLPSAATAAIDAAALQGEIAADRVRDVLGRHATQERLAVTTVDGNRAQS